MTWLDSRGRLLGKVSIVDGVLVLFLAALSPVVIYAYRANRPLPLQVTEILPREVPSGGILQIRGMNFTPQSQVLLGGSPASGIDYYGSNLLMVYLHRGFLPGSYSVSVRNPNGPEFRSEMEVEILPAVSKGKVPLILTVGIDDLDRETADLLEKGLADFGEHEGGAPRLLRILGRYSMETDPSKERILADVFLIGEAEWWEKAEHYYYGGEPLHVNFRVPLEISGRTYPAIIHREPKPAFLDPE